MTGKSAKPSRRKPRAGILKIRHVFADVFAADEYGEIPVWPPDVFCFAAAVLHQSGAYTRIASGLPLAADFGSKEAREKTLDQMGEEWRTSGKPPSLAVQWWNLIKKNAATPLKDVLWNDRLTAALINLIAVADETCRGIGMSQFVHDKFLWEAEFVLIDSDSLTLCKTIDPTRYSVLPKMHTAQSGLTIRSFTHNLSFLHCREMAAEWHRAFTAPDLFRAKVTHAFNLLVIPWPQEVQPSQFVASGQVRLTDEVKRGSYGLFAIKPVAPPRPEFVKELVQIAEKQVGQINGVILPELALKETAFRQISDQIVTLSRFFLSGIGSEGSPKKGADNYLRFDFGIPGGEFVVSLRQHKHHRWKITKPQILQYGIGTNLHPEANWWEHISLDHRTLLFLNLRPWLTLAPLICEDLARPEPVGDLVRAIGPNLVIALLMDGPQLGGRWPGRYAASLADDPGCSVLTLTSGGMSHLSKTREGPDRSNVVALWKDPRRGTQELELPKDANALVLNVTVEYDEEWTADGRGDRRTSGYPILAGSHPITYAEKIKTR